MKCLNCKQSFTPQRNGQIVCSAQCSYEYQVKRNKERKAKEDKEWKHRKKKLKNKLKTSSQHKGELQKLVNSCIREIDSGYGCISCDTGKVEQAGHYRSVGSNPELRYDPFNIFGQCVHDNMHKSGAPIEFREGLIQRYGKETAGAFLEHSRPFNKLTIDDIQQLKKVARNFLKWLRNEDKLYSIEETIQLRQDLLIEMQKSVNYEEN